MTYYVGNHANRDKSAPLQQERNEQTAKPIDPKKKSSGKVPPQENDAAPKKQ